MSITKQNKHLFDAFEKLNNSNKLYMLNILQAMEFTQNSCNNYSHPRPKSKKTKNTPV